MNPEDLLKEALETHPCYNEQAHRNFARMHVPVAPKCNIQCNYCNRKYDCCNESRPGVTSEVLSPEQAGDKIGYVLSRIPNLKVIGIAGPGDPLANEETFSTLKIINERYPDLIPCISTNGLALPASAERLYSLGVRFVTVTINAADPEIGARIYNSAIWEGKVLHGTEASSMILRNQLEGIRKCHDLGMLVKANIVMVPEINASHIPELVKTVKSLGAYIVNILPLIPVPGTAFENCRGPTPAERKALMDECSLDARMMRHCRQCRADAIGLLDDDRSSEFTGCGYGHGDGCGPREEVPNMVLFDTGATHIVAIATTSGEYVDAGFGNTPEFSIYRIGKEGNELLRKVNTQGQDLPAVGQSHRERIDSIINLMDDCDAIIVKEIGDMPRSAIESRGKKVILSSGRIDGVLSNLLH